MRVTEWRVRGIIDNDRIGFMTKIKHHVGPKPSPNTFSPLVTVPDYSITGHTFRSLKFATAEHKKRTRLNQEINTDNTALTF
jgi:hypothetical protein